MVFANPHTSRFRIQKPLSAVWLLQLGLIFYASAATTALGQTIDVEERWTTKGSAEIGEFASITGMLEVEPGTVWVSDAMTSRVIAVTDDGRQSWLVARDGKGPGEVVAPSFMARMPKGEVALYNRSAIEIFSSDGNFVHRVHVPVPIDNVKGFTVLPSEDFIVSGGILGNEYSVHRISSRGRVLSSWDSIPRTQNPRAGVMIAGGPVHALPDGHILFSRAAPHELIVFDGNGRPVETVASDPDLLHEIGDDFIIETVEQGQFRRSFRWHFPQSRAVFRLDDQTVMNIVAFHEQGRTLWEVHRPDQPVTRTVVPRAYSPWAMTSNGDVLVSYPDPDTDEPIAALVRVRIRAGGR